MTKALKSAITIFSKAQGMSYSHIRNFTITVALTKIFANASSDSSLILITPSCVTNDEIYAKSVTGRKKRKKTRKPIVKLFALHANAKTSHRNNTQYPLYYVPKSLGNFCRGLLERSKCQIIHFFSGTSHSGDSHGGTLTTSNISFHLTET